MDGKKKRARGKEEKKAARTVRQADSAGGATPSPARAVRKAALTLPDATATAAPPPVDDDEPVAAAEESGTGDGNGVEEEDDDEQVERFYALLANIRALRGLAPPCVAAAASCGGAESGDTGAAMAKKRLRAALEPPWRPAFRMEDFEEPAPAPAKRKQRAEDGGESAAVVATSPSVPHAAVRVDSGSHKD